MWKYLLICSLSMVMVTSATAAPWVRGFVVSNYEPAFYYGGKPGFEKSGIMEPGSDCPNGTLPELDYSAVLKTSWRSDADVAAIVHPPGVDPTAIHFLEERGLSYLGFRNDIETYINPFAAPDPGMQEVTGKIAEGFDLDGNTDTGGFTSPSGERGIDNAYYRAWGCIASFRKPPYTATLSIRGNDKMLEGLYTMVIRISGSKDPMNDDDVTLEVGYSPDHIIKDGAGAVSDYSFRVVKSVEYTRMKAKIKNGVVETEQVAELHTPRFSWFPDNSGDTDFHKGRIRLVINADGNASGLIGGYRDWRDLYVEDTFAQSGGTQDTREHHNSVGMYYALKRNADGMPDPKTGENMGISIAYRFIAVPAFVVDPVKPVGIVVPEGERGEIAKYQAMRTVFFKAIATKKIQPVPAGSSEAAAPQLPQNSDGTLFYEGVAVGHAPNSVQPPSVLPKSGKIGQQATDSAPPTVASLGPAVAP